MDNKQKFLKFQHHLAHAIKILNILLNFCTKDKKKN